MSGLEVAGVVLGVIPIAIEALKIYVKVLSSMRSAKRDIQALIRDLETEQVRLRSTCELLLDGVVPLDHIENLMKVPFGPEWKQYSQQLKYRLLISPDYYEDRMTSMLEASNELKNMLGVQPDGKLKYNDPPTIIQELKRRVSFTLRKRDYDGVISRIKDGNSALYSLVEHNRKLEPSRKRYAQNHLTKLLRDLSKSIFEALRISTTCGCSTSHCFCLELCRIDSVPVASDQDEEFAKTLQFHIAFGSNREFHNEGPNLDTPLKSQFPPSMFRWDSLDIKLAQSDAQASSNIHSSIAATQPRKVHFASSIELEATRNDGRSFTQTQTIITSTQAKMNTALSSRPKRPDIISNLCQLIRRRGKMPAHVRHGVITHAAKQFEVFDREPPVEFDSPVTLREALETDDLNFGLNLRDKIEIALAVSAGIPHLSGTGWLTILTLDDIVLLRIRENQSLGTSSAYRTFISRDHRRSQAISLPGNFELDKLGDTSRPVCFSLLSIGALLAQVIIGKPFGALEMRQSLDFHSVIAMNKFVERQRGKIVEYGGRDIMEAIDWCFDSVLRISSLGDEHFCQKYQAEVVQRLEMSSNILSGEIF